MDAAALSWWWRRSTAGLLSYETARFPSWVRTRLYRMPVGKVLQRILCIENKSEKPVPAPELDCSLLTCLPKPGFAE